MAKWSGFIADPNDVDWNTFPEPEGHFGPVITTPTEVINKHTGEVMARAVGNNRFYMGHHHAHIAPVEWLLKLEKDYPHTDDY